MSDIDFDELDKAVNNLMSNVDTTKRAEGLDDPEDKMLTLDGDGSNDNLTDGIATADATPDTPAVVAVPTQPVASPTASSPPLATKRRGQFMDVMHPSSDMKSAPKPVKREGVALAPPADNPKPAPVPAPIPDEPSLQSLDSLELAMPDQPEDDQPPQTSPFLPDAKPEKRPLGGTASDLPTPIVDLAAELDIPKDTSQSAETPAEPEPVELPAELGSDVLAIEANGLPDEVATAEPAEPQPTELETAPELSAEEPTNVPAGGSIPQQYTESPSSGDQTNGSIYDTSNYHQPIEASAVAPKKSSPLKWIILAIVLLVLGAGGGLAYFVFTNGWPF